MEIELQANNKDTLMHGLTAWNKIENMFRDVFSEDSLKDRDYLKMKLAEYDRLHYRHSGTAQTTDERALSSMLRFQRRKMERSLYPGLLTRMVRRALRYLSPAINGRRELAMASQAGSQPYLNRPLPVREPGPVQQSAKQNIAEPQAVSASPAQGRQPQDTRQHLSGSGPHLTHLNRKPKHRRTSKHKGPAM